MPVPKADAPKAMPLLANRQVVSLKKLLVPLDFSDYASAAVDYAITIASQRNVQCWWLGIFQTNHRPSLGNPD